MGVAWQWLWAVQTLDVARRVHQVRAPLGVPYFGTLRLALLVVWCVRTQRPPNERGQPRRRAHPRGRRRLCRLEVRVHNNPVAPLRLSLASPTRASAYYGLRRLRETCRPACKCSLAHAAHRREFEQIAVGLDHWHHRCSLSPCSHTSTPPPHSTACFHEK